MKREFSDKKNCQRNEFATAYHVIKRNTLDHAVHIRVPLLEQASHLSCLLYKQGNAEPKWQNVTKRQRFLQVPFSA